MFNPPNFEEYSSIYFIYFGVFPLHKKSAIITYSVDGFGRDKRMSVIMLDTRLSYTEIFPVIVGCSSI